MRQLTGEQEEEEEGKEGNAYLVQRHRVDNGRENTRLEFGIIIVRRVDEQLVVIIKGNLGGWIVR